MAGSDFDVERARLAAARHLPASCHDDFLRLSRTLVHGPTFQWLLVDASDEGLRKQVMAALDDVLHAARLRTNRLPLSAKIIDVAMLEARLIKNARAASVVHVIGRPGWFDAARWDAFNARRERLATEARARLVFWLDADSISLASRGAPDLWAWRSGVYAFVPAVRVARVAGSANLALASEAHVTPLPPGPMGVDTRSMAQRSHRVAEIRSWLASQPAPPDELLASPLDELGKLLFDLGDFEAALRYRQDVEIPLHRRMGNTRAAGITQGQIADILKARGQFDEALRVLQDEVLLIFERLGDAHSKAVTMGKIADILQVRGQLDEALRIRKDEELPVYERLGDVRSKAVTMGQIADILETRGQLDEALRIRRDEELPIFERLGDVRAKAVTMGQIADILKSRGQFDEALRIHRDEELPVYERLGDVHSRAVTMGQIADILQSRGQFDEALRIRTEEELPVYERLGDVRSKINTMGRIADILQARGHQDEALRIYTEEQLPVYESLGDVHSKAVAMGRIADILQARGQLDEALRIRKEEQLPVFERMGDMRAKAITKVKIGLQLLNAGNAAADEAKQLLSAAWADLSRMGLPEAEVLAEEMHSLGLTLPAT